MRINKSSDRKEHKGMKKGMKKRTVAAVFCTAFMMMVMPMTAFAQTGPEAECICDTKCSEENVNEECPVCKTDISLCQGTETVSEDSAETVSGNDASVESTEEYGPLTPDGNMSIVDDYGTLEAGGKQFITVVTKSGNYFYIIIDRDDEGDETVHFLNLVDESDLMALMDEDEQKAYAESIAAETTESENSATVESTEVSAENAETDADDSQKEAKKSGGITPAAVVAILLLLVGGGYFGYKFLKETGQKKPSSSPDPDADYSEDDEDYLSTLNGKEDTSLEDPEDEDDVSEDENERDPEDTDDDFTDPEK